MVFPVVMYGCESWTVKKAEHRRIDAFELWCWRRLLRGPWTARRSNQSILKEIRPGCSLEGLMLKLKLQYFGHLMQTAKDFPDPSRSFPPSEGKITDLKLTVHSIRYCWVIKNILHHLPHSTTIKVGLKKKISEKGAPLVTQW